jgi:AraC family transcriptional regulator of adaptative response / DNA-3-methyladenine glycosylase II
MYHQAQDDHTAAYLALCARDARFDGRFFVGVTSTGIYCRPVCRVRTPKRENCRFFNTRAQAESSAFRPCLKCRPEIAPGFSQMDSSNSLAQSAAQHIDHAVQQGRSIALPDLAARLGVTDRHLRRIFQASHGVAPHDYLSTQRLLLAKQLLTDTALPVSQVALASGFESLRRFNAAFAERYRLNPTQLRKARPMAEAALQLAWRPPYDVEAMVGHFERRVVTGVEAVDASALTLRRTLAWPHEGQMLYGWILLRFDPAQCQVRLQASDSLSPVLGALLQRVRHALDLDADSDPVDAVMASLPLPLRPGLRLPGCFDGFEAAVRVVLGQQVTVKAARTLLQRLVNRLGEPIETPFADLTLLFPTPAAVAAADPATIGLLGIVRQRVRALQALAGEVASGRIVLERGMPIEPTLEALQQLPGIGPWTAQLIAMRALAWPDAWPASDVGLMIALGSRDAKEITRLAESWRPWRAYAVMRLWHAIETKEIP